MLKTFFLLVLPALCLAQDLPSWSVIAHDIFDAIDLNGNGEWTRIEMDAYFQTFDANSNGLITYEEFVDAIDAQADYFIGHEQEWYENFDANNDNVLNHIDFNFAFFRYDLNANGIVTIYEYEYALGLSGTK